MSLFALAVISPLVSSALDGNQTNLTDDRIEKQSQIASENLPNQAPPAVTIEKSTRFPIVLDSVINSEKSRDGDKISAHLSEDFVVGDVTVLPAGSKIEGRIIKFEDVGPPMRILMELKFDSIKIVDKMPLSLSAEVAVGATECYVRCGLKGISIPVSRAGSGLPSGLPPARKVFINPNNIRVNVMVGDDIRHAHFAMDSRILLANDLIKIELKQGDVFKIQLKENLAVPNSKL